MSRIDGHEDEVNGILHRIETMIAARTAAGATKADLENMQAQLDLREEAIAAREADVLERERQVAAREAAVGQRENLQQITPPPPPVQARPRRALCDHCGQGVCARNSACYDNYGNDLHRHNCYECYRPWKSGGKGGKGKWGSH